MNDAINQLLYLTLVKRNALTGSIGTRPPMIYTDNFKPNMWSDLAVQILDKFSGEFAHDIIRFQSAHNLTPDGIIGPHTWAALGVRDWEDDNELIMQCARWMAYAPVRETEGNNRGKMIRDLYNSRDGDPWCVRAATWPLRVIGGIPKVKERSSSSGLALAGLRKGLCHARSGFSNIHLSGRFRIRGKLRHIPLSPKPILLPCYVLIPGGPTGLKHTAIGWKINDGWVYVIEGNVRPRKWLKWQYDIVRPGRYRLDKVVMVSM